MKTKDRLTEWPIIIRAFVPGRHHFCKNGRQSIGLFGRKCTDYDDNWGEAGTKIGSSVHRPIDPSAERGVVLRWPDEPMARWPDRLAFPLCTSKQKGLAINSENLAKIYVIETKTVSSFLAAGQRKNAGGKNEGICHYVIENKWWKNVRNRPFHYVDENKDSYRRLSIMLMKIKVVIKKQ